MTGSRYCCHRPTRYHPRAASDPARSAIKEKATSAAAQHRGTVIRFPAGDRYLSSRKRLDRLQGPHNLLVSGYRGLRGVEVTTDHLHLVPRLRLVELCYPTPTHTHTLIPSWRDFVWVTFGRRTFVVAFVSDRPFSWAWFEPDSHCS